MPRNIANLVKTTKSKASRGALTSADARLIIGRSASVPSGSRWATALLTGARQGEVLGLQWDRVNLDAADDPDSALMHSECSARTGAPGMSPGAPVFAT